MHPFHSTKTKNFQISQTSQTSNKQNTKISNLLDSKLELFRQKNQKLMESLRKNHDQMEVEMEMTVGNKKRQKGLSYGGGRVRALETICEEQGDSVPERRMRNSLLIPLPEMEKYRQRIRML